MDVADYQVQTLGECLIDSPLDLPVSSAAGIAGYVSDSVRISLSIEQHLGDPAAVKPTLEKAGPRAKIFFRPGYTRAAIMTCGGLSPGLNNVIRSLYLQLFYRYGVKTVLGLRDGYRSLNPKYGHQPIRTHAGRGRAHPPDSRHHPRHLARQGRSRPRGGHARSRGHQHPVRHRRRRHAQGCAPDLERSGAARAEDRHRRRAQDDRQRHQLRLQDLRVRHRGRTGHQGARLRAHRSAQPSARHRPGQDHGPRLRVRGRLRHARQS